MWTSFKRLASKNAATQQLHQTSGQRQISIKNNVFQLSHGIKNIHRRKLYQSYTDLRKTFLQLFLGTIARCLHFPDRVEKLVVYLGLYESSSHFSRRKTKQILFMRSKLSLPYANLQSDIPKYKLILKTATENVAYVSAYFCGDTK